MSDDQRIDHPATAVPVRDLVQRGTDRFHDQLAETRLQAKRATAPASTAS